MRYLVIRQLPQEQACYIEPTTCNLVIITAVEIFVWVKRMSKIFVFLVLDSVPSHTFRRITLISVSLWTHTMALEKFQTVNITGTKWCPQFIFYISPFFAVFAFFTFFSRFLSQTGQVSRSFQTDYFNMGNRATNAYREMLIYCIINIVAPACFGHLLWLSSGKCSLKDRLHRRPKNLI
jgi:hypothetical protein